VDKQQAYLQLPGAVAKLNASLTDVEMANLSIALLAHVRAMRSLRQSEGGATQQ
jgi:hypothetical protein